MSFDELETIVGNERPEWKAPLQHVSGIYAIADTPSNRLYVGAAYGDGGVWSRWSVYVSTGHGGNVKLSEVIGPDGLDYCRRNFRFALLEALLPTAPVEEVRAREMYWKQVLRTHGEWGLNRN